MSVDPVFYGIAGLMIFFVRMKPFGFHIGVANVKECEVLTRQEIYGKIQKCCGYMTVLLEGEIISQGTAFAFTAKGNVLTAAHVVTGRVPILEKDYRDPKCKFYIKFAGREQVEYRVDYCSVGISNSAFTEIIQLDIAELSPVKCGDEDFDFLPACLHPPRLGDEVYLAGYSDDLSLPFNIDKLIKRESPGAQLFLDEMRKGYMADMMGAFVRSSVVGNARKILAESGEDSIEVNVFYMDNGVSSGASGGPVVNKRGEAVGLISQRAVTSASQSSDTKLKVPSGATIGLSLQPMEYVRNLISRR